MYKRRWSADCKDADQLTANTTCWGTLCIHVVGIVHMLWYVGILYTFIFLASFMCRFWAAFSVRGETTDWPICHHHGLLNVYVAEYRLSYSFIDAIIRDVSRIISRLSLILQPLDAQDRHPPTVHAPALTPPPVTGTLRLCPKPSNSRWEKNA